MDDRVILVDARDRETGSAAKLEVHRTGALHRAFSVFVFDHAGTLLLQRRARTKYHSGGLWTNTCCGHPRPGEATADAARRRLHEEMGFACDLVAAGTFTYRADVGNGLIEHELDHVFIGRYDGVPRPAPTEVDGWRRTTVAELHRRMLQAPARFTTWLPMALAVALQATSGVERPIIAGERR